MIPAVAAVSFLLALHPDLEPAKLEALHQQRVEWMKVRRVDPPHGVYQDFRIAPAPSGVLPFRVQELAKASGIQILLTDREPRIHNGVLWLKRPATLQPPSLPNLFSEAELPKPKDLKRWLSAFRQYPAEFSGLTGGAPLLTWFKLEPGDAPLAPIVQHVLARELVEAEVMKSLESNRMYQAEEWLCDSSGFAFWASNNQGVFEIGDQFPLQGNTRLEARLPVAGVMRVYRDDELVHEASGMTMRFDAKQPGVYRLEVDLEANGAKRSWIRTKPIVMTAAEAVKMPNLLSKDDAVETISNIAYVENGDNKQKLDLYFPKGKTNVPLFVFIHGGSWVSGDKSLYAPIGVMFAKRGIAVAIPSYRLAPKNPYPAQIDDVAAAFAWVAKNIGKYGSVVDPQRIFLGGHSAGGHLAALLALDSSYLKKFDIDPRIIRGVAALSGVYDVRLLPLFGDIAERMKASPLEFVRKDAPPFLVSYCQWDYLGLPYQAKELADALRKAFVPSRLLYVPGRTHITEVISMLKDGDLTTEAVIRLIEKGQP